MSAREQDDTTRPEDPGSDAATPSEEEFLRRVATGRDPAEAEAAPAGLGPDASRFEIRRLLGAGGFGTVYEAFDRAREARVALKTMDRRDARAVYRFKQEFRALAENSHPNLVQLYELHGDGERWFFTMELCHGQDALAYVSAEPGGEPSQAARSPASESTVLRSPADPFDAAGAHTVELPPPPRPRADRAFDEGRLRDVLRQLAEGLCYLHARGRLHRDVKPSNVMVDPEGRVVLLDFGLAVELGPEGDRSSGVIAGTPHYMAPEQAGSGPIGPAADWYAVGVMLYQALTGALPFEGGGIEVLGRKLLADPTPPGELAAGLPEDLARLSMDLLARDPARRPSGEEVLSRIGRADPRGPAHAEDEGPRRSGAFVGREEELARLRLAFEATRRGSAAAALVHGLSGMGKSALLARFAEDLRRDEPGVVILSGRCYEQESVPYKALDGLVDALGRRLQRMTDAEVLAVLPRDVATLSRLFPVLARVPAVASAPRRAEAADGLALRIRAFAALRELLARLGDRASLALVIDDLQWGDADGGALLADLIRPPDAPAMLVVLAYRSDEAAESACLRALLPTVRALSGPGLAVSEIDVGELGEEDALALALADLSRDGAEPPDAARAAEIVREAGGSAFFIRELCRAGGEHGADGASLEAMLARRVRALPDAARRLLEAISVAGQPIARAVAVQAAALGDEGPPAIGALRRQRLLRVRGTRDEIEPYHDRIREAVVAEVAPGAKRGYHLGLAAALLDAGQADDETLAVHFEGAGEAAKAAEHTIRAADQAMDAVGFDRAARLYRQAIAQIGEGDGRRRLLHERLGAALGNAGRGAEAAAAYMVSVEGAPADQALELRRRAAEHYLNSGHIEEGLATLRVVLAATGLSMPATRFGAVIRLLVLSLWVRLRGLRFRERSEGEIPPGDLLRVDTCAAVVLSMIPSSPITAFYFHKLGLLLALRAGDPYRLLRAFSVEVGARTAARASARSMGEIERVFHALAGRLQGGPRFAAYGGAIAMTAGVVAMFRGHYREACEHFERASSWFGANAGRISNESAYTSFFHVQVLYAAGQWKEACRRLAVSLEEARARGNRWLEIELTKMAYLPALMEDRPDAAREAVDRIETLWSRAYHSQRFTLLPAWGATALYRDGGAGEATLALVKASWPALARSGLLVRSHAIRNEYVGIRARAHIAAAMAAAGPRRGALLRSAERDARALERTGTAVGAAYGVAIRAGAAACRGDRERARALLVEAVARFEEAELSIHAAASRRRLGDLVGGDEGRALVEAADAIMSAQGIRSPARMTAMLLPGAW